MPDTPNPYAFKVGIRRWSRLGTWYAGVWWPMDDGDEVWFGPFDSEADANTHADLVLAALKGATRE